MADDVVSTGGAGQIAQEATLSALLNAVTGSSGSSAAMQVQQLAQASGVAAKSQENFAAQVVKTTDAAQGLVKSFINGTATSSQVFGAMGTLPGPIGLVFKGLSMIAGFQEEAMTQYQTMSKAGVSFGGSLTDMRNAAASTHMTLSDFANFMKDNGQAMAMLGGSANEGAKAFVKLSNELLTSDAGVNLKALGYTTNEVNQGMANYIAMTGGRSKDELKNSKQITEGTTNYLEQLDRLADVTGKSRDQIQSELKQKQEAADLELYKASLSAEDREKFSAAYNDALTKYGQGAADNVLAAAQGRAVTTEAGKKYAALAPMATKSLQDQYAATMKYGAKSQQAREAEDAARLANRTEFQRFGGVLGSATDVLKGNEAAARQAARDTATGMTSKKALDGAEADRAKKKKDQEDSQAASMARAETNLKEFSSALNSFLGPFVAVLTPVISGLSYLAPVIGALAVALVAMKAAAIAYNTFMTAKAGLASGGIKGMLGFGSGGPAAAAPAGSGALAGAGGAAGGAGGGFVGFIKALGRGLASLAPIAVPMIIGAGAVAATIAILGAGVAAAIALIGVGLPVFAKGLKTVSEVDGLNLMKVAGALALLGPAMLIFSGSMIAAGLMTAGSKILSFFTGGGPIDQVKTMALELGPLVPTIEKIGPALQNYATGIVAFGKAVSTVDLGKAERLKEVMKGPGVLEGIGTAIRDVGQATAKLMTSNTAGAEKSGSELTALNNSIRELIKVSRDISDYTKQNLDATKKISGDHFA